MFDIDFIGVGEESKSGDAITARFGSGHGPGRAWTEQQVVVIDGGFKSTSTAIQAHLRDHYGASRIDLLISTHPDADHVNGLQDLFANCEIGRLWMHRPWLHGAATRGLYQDGRITTNSLSERLARALLGAKELENAANAAGVPVEEPFTSLTAFGGCVEVVGPSLEYYEELLPEFRSSPALASSSPSWAARHLSAASALATRVVESLDIETLTDSGTTSAENNSSAVILLRSDDHGHVLLTADAGIPALERVAARLTAIQATRPELLQAPHHGSQRNLGPTVLDRIAGPRGERAEESWASVISAAPGGAPKHPHPRVTNALRRRGAKVVATHGRIVHWGDPREGWGPLAPIPFISEFEEDE